MNRLRETREVLNWSQAYLAEKLNVLPVTVGRWERGERTPYAIHQQALEEVLGVPFAELGFDEQKEKSLIEEELPLKERPNTYFVQDRSSEDELTRLALQSRLLTESMGGLLPEQPDPSRFNGVLDVGCGSGAWLTETAAMHPASQCVGIDVSQLMIDYAREQARIAGIGNVEFHTKDALQDSLFPEKSFDLVNLRLASSFLRSWDWSALLQKLQYMTITGGTVRVTDAIGVDTNSQTVNGLSSLVLQARASAGHDMEAVVDHDGDIPSRFAVLFERAGFRDIGIHRHNLQYTTPTTAKAYFIEDMTRLISAVKPFLQKWSHIPDDYEARAQQAISDMNEEKFEATWHLFTVYGTRP